MINSIEQQLSAALILEHQTRSLEKALQASYPLISRLVKLEEHSAGKQLLEFVQLYIRSVPSLLGDFLYTAKKFGLSASVQPLVNIANSFLNFPAEKIGARSGITALMIKAYLANRLLEEVNDACHYHIGKTMIPIDMTLTNMIIHTIIGEPFANDMDELVDTAVENLFSQHEEVQEEFMHQITDSNLVHIWQRLPSLSNQAGLQARLPY